MASAYKIDIAKLHSLQKHAVTLAGNSLQRQRQQADRPLKQATTARRHDRALPQVSVLLLWQVATRRTRTAGKVEIPNVDDHVSKLEHMGKETVKKLQDIKGAAIQAGVDINIPENCINKGACCKPAFTPRSLCKL